MPWQARAMRETVTGRLEPALRDEGELVRGRGRFVDDQHFDGELFDHVVRSPHPHARIQAIDTAAGPPG
jgi:CO/xanthine dehydrogenase Mo-binding subunit